MIQGTTNLLNFSELEDTSKLQQMFQVFNNTRDMVSILDRCINADGVKVYVGRESGIEGLGNCSLITSPYQADGETLGVLGVVGPTRMNYKDVIPVVEITAKLLSDCELELLEEGGHFTNEGYELFIQNTVIKSIVK